MFCPVNLLLLGSNVRLLLNQPPQPLSTAESFHSLYTCFLQNFSYLAFYLIIRHYTVLDASFFKFVTLPFSQLSHMLDLFSPKRGEMENSTTKYSETHFLHLLFCPVLFLQPHPILTICIVLSGREIWQECGKQVASVSLDPTDWPEHWKGLISSSEPRRPHGFELQD